MSGKSEEKRTPRIGRPMTPEDYRIIGCDGMLAVWDLTDGYIHDERFETREEAEAWIAENYHGTWYPPETLAARTWVM